MTVLLRTRHLDDCLQCLLIILGNHERAGTSWCLNVCFFNAHSLHLVVKLFQNDSGPRYLEPFALVSSIFERALSLYLKLLLCAYSVQISESHKPIGDSFCYPPTH
jgi:hypothetical protein